MSKLLHCSHITSTPQFTRTLSSVILSNPRLRCSRSSPGCIKAHSFFCASPIPGTPFFHHSPDISRSFPRTFSARAFNDSSPPNETLEKGEDGEKKELDVDGEVGHAEEYPSGEFEYEEFGVLKKFGVKLRMLVALPWNRVRKGSVLTMKLRGQVLDLLIITRALDSYIEFAGCPVLINWFMFFIWGVENSLCGIAFFRYLTS